MPRSYQPPSWKYRELVSAFGDDLDVAEVIRAAGFKPPSVKTIEGWRMRDSVPSSWLPLLIDAALAKGLLDSVSQLQRKDAAA